MPGLNLEQVVISLQVFYEGRVQGVGFRQFGTMENRALAIQGKLNAVIAVRKPPPRKKEPLRHIF